jgi:hypothetical protein
MGKKIPLHLVALGTIAAAPVISKVLKGDGRGKALPAVGQKVIARKG